MEGGKKLNKDKRKKQEQRIKKEELELRKNKKELSKLKKSGKKKTKSKTNGKSSRKNGWFPFFMKEEIKETVQDTIPYKRMLKDGICQIDKKKFNKKY